jgi:hypothetical protein
MTVQELEVAQSLQAKEPIKACELFKQLLQNTKGSHRLIVGDSEDDIKIKETSIVKLGELYRDLK